MIEETNQEDEQELYENYRIEVDKGQSLLRIDKFLMDRIENTSRNKIQQAAEAGFIKVNERAVKSNYRVHPNDIIQIFLPTAPRELEIIAEDIPLNIIYEDDDILIVNKESEMVVHPGFANYTGTLLNGLKYYLEDKKDKEGKPCQALLVHRIDKNTTGLLLVAKNERAQTLIGKQFYDHSVERTYIALVWGDIEESSGTIDEYIGRSHKDRRVMQVFPEADYGKQAITHYRTLFRYGYVTLVECKLETGRTHQIRSHMQYLGHSLFNDATYGGDKILKGTTFTKYKQFINNCFKVLPRQALHAKTLGFIHPTTNQAVLFQSELPDDMQELINKWQHYINHNQPAEKQISQAEIEASIRENLGKNN